MWITSIMQCRHDQGTRFEVIIASNPNAWTFMPPSARPEEERWKKWVVHRWHECFCEVHGKSHFAMLACFVPLKKENKSHG